MLAPARCHYNTCRGWKLLNSGSLQRGFQILNLEVILTESGWKSLAERWAELQGAWGSDGTWVCEIRSVFGNYQTALERGLRNSKRG